MHSRKRKLKVVIRESAMKDLRCMSFLGRDQARIVVAGCQDVMFKIDIEKGTIVEQVQFFAQVLLRR